jgi:hypothetical protein
LLAEYKQEHGDANIGAKAEYRGIKLGTWLRNTKAALVNPKKTSPEPWIVKRLAALGVAWACTAVTRRKLRRCSDVVERWFASAFESQY